MDDLHQRLQFAQQLARECGALALREAQQLTISNKGAHDVLTQADLAVEQHIRAQVAQQFAQDAVVGEELGGQADVDVARDFWLVDPIDGTANYATGIPRWCISIGFLRAGQPVLGVIYDPVHNHLYAARSGHGATLNGAPMRVRAKGTLSSATFELGWSARLPPQPYLRAVNTVFAAGAQAVRRGSGALGLCDVAAGRIDGYGELHINPWDCAAGLLLVQEAGGRANPYFTPQGIRQGGLLVCAAAPVYDEFLLLMTRALASAA
jgi:myo-inositol-1(or 4)-monophosphatase